MIDTNIRTVRTEQLRQIQDAMNRAIPIVNWTSDNCENMEQVDEANAALVELAEARDSFAQMLALPEENDNG